MNKKKLFLIAGLPLLIAVIFTILVKFVDVEPIGPEGSRVGFAALNAAVHPTEDISKTWYMISNLAWPILIVIMAFYAVLGFVQLIKRKSLLKVDRELLILAGFYLAMFAVFVLFEKLIVINYRPVILGDGLEPSYPSTHTLFSLCVCGSAIMVNRILFKNKYVKFVNVALALVAFFIIFSRLLSGAHWLTDILGGILIANAMLAILALIYKRQQPRSRRTA